MGNESDNKEYLYENNYLNWYEFPIDTSADGFCKLVNNSGKLHTTLTRGQIQTAVNHLCFDRENEKKDKRDDVGIDVKNAIYRDVYLWYLENQHENASFQLNMAKKENRNPSHFYWETRDLLMALTIAFSKDTGLKNEYLAQQTLKEFGLLLGEKSVADVESDVITQKFLVDHSVQESMILSFEKDLEKRLRAVWDLSHQIASQDKGKAMMETLRKLDLILLELTDLKEQQSDVDGGHQVSRQSAERESTAYEEIERLYKEALALRNYMRQRRPSKKSADVTIDYLYFTLPSGEENEKLLKDIKRLLEKFNRNSKKTVEAEFEVLYKKYLLAHENRPDRTQAAVSFLMDYQRLEQYAHGKSAIMEFAEQYRQELYSFARDIFDSTDRSYMDFRKLQGNTFQYANDAFAYGRLYSVHQEIWNEINIPIWLSRIQQVLVDLWNCNPWNSDKKTELNNEWKRLLWIEHLNNVLQPKIEQVHGKIQETRNRLHVSYPNIPMLTSNAPEIIERFIHSYNDVSDSVYFQKKVTQREIEGYLIAIPSDYQKVVANNVASMRADGIVMEMECKILVAALIDEAVEKIKKEHNKLDSILESYRDHK